MSSEKTNPKAFATTVAFEGNSVEPVQTLYPSKSKKASRTCKSVFLWIQCIQSKAGVFAHTRKIPWFSQSTVWLFISLLYRNVFYLIERKKLMKFAGGYKSRPNNLIQFCAVRPDHIYKVNVNSKNILFFKCNIWKREFLGI